MKTNEINFHRIVGPHGSDDNVGLKEQNHMIFLQMNLNGEVTEIQEMEVLTSALVMMKKPYSGLHLEGHAAITGLSITLIISNGRILLEELAVEALGVGGMNQTMKRRKLICIHNHILFLSV